MVGEAFTVRFIPMREDLATPAALGARDNPSRIAIDTVPQGAVLVIDGRGLADIAVRSGAHTSALQSLMRTSYAGFCLKKKPPAHPTLTIRTITRISVRQYHSLYTYLHPRHG